ncbi:MAG TPA: cytidine deaminase [Candidatus Limnocylindria bacterium]|nr:cytidine deaminase [Candidatus Limnocylindria bacterium]
MTPERLMAEAERARRKSYAPYSRFTVGAALLTHKGQVFRACNVENASYGLSVCAERNAVWKAVSEGEREFVAIAITARQGHGAPPCGSCRQVLHEFAPEAIVYWRDARGRIVRRPLGELLPLAFKFPSRKRKRP